jgi:hypothetical protein
MKKTKSALTFALVIATLGFGTMTTFTACARQPAKMEAQSSTWKVSVQSVVKLPQKPDKDRRSYPSANSQFDLIEVAFTAELLGAGGKIAMPNAVLVDGKGQTYKTVQFSREFPERISNMPEGHEKDEEMQRFMICLSPELVGKEPCPIATGEKLSLTSSFIDPKDYTNLKLSFGDVPPITLKAPQN